MASWTTRITNESALKKLAALLGRRGVLSEKIINETPGMPGSHFYNNRFGGLVNAYRLVGFTPKRDYAYMAGNLQRVRRTEALREEVAAALRLRGISVQKVSRTALALNDGQLVAVMLGRCRIQRGVPTWQVQIQLDRRLDWVVIARLAPNNEDIQDYWLVRGGVSFVAISAKHRKVHDQRSFTRLPPLLDALRDAVAAAERHPFPSERSMPKVQNCRFREKR
jgi:hypothetical protein